ATRNRTGAEYDAPYAARAAAGHNIHGEANLITTLLQAHFPSRMATAPETLHILDAGCGTGRTGIELARRSHQVIGVDLDPVMLAQARAKAPELVWHLADLATLTLDQPFDCIVMAGNVMIFLTPGTEAAVLHNMAAHLAPGGLLVAGFESRPPSWSNLTPDRYDNLATAAGLTLVERWAGWDREPWRAYSNYALFVHKLASQQDQ
ncbi:MAG: class I SAM-dependent methyltransferase, partial [Caldilineaceae bacterium]|nr:class I SAM-dependent methyltransferase [Caldilineaceae bacterium]